MKLSLLSIIAVKTKATTTSFEMAEKIVSGTLNTVNRNHIRIYVLVYVH